MNIFQCPTFIGLTTNDIQQVYRKSEYEGLHERSLSSYESGQEINFQHSITSNAKQIDDMFYHTFGNSIPSSENKLLPSSKFVEDNPTLSNWVYCFTKFQAQKFKFIQLSIPRSVDALFVLPSARSCMGREIHISVISNWTSSVTFCSANMQEMLISLTCGVDVAGDGNIWPLKPFVRNDVSSMYLRPFTRKPNFDTNTQSIYPRGMIRFMSDGQRWNVTGQTFHNMSDNINNAVFQVGSSSSGGGLSSEIIFADPFSTTPRIVTNPYSIEIDSKGRVVAMETEPILYDFVARVAFLRIPSFSHEFNNQAVFNPYNEPLSLGTVYLARNYATSKMVVTCNIDWRLTVSQRNSVPKPLACIIKRSLDNGTTWHRVLYPNETVLPIFKYIHYGRDYWVGNAKIVFVDDDVNVINQNVAYRLFVQLEQIGPEYCQLFVGDNGSYILLEEIGVQDAGGIIAANQSFERWNGVFLPGSQQLIQRYRFIEVFGRSQYVNEYVAISNTLLTIIPMSIQSALHFTLSFETQIDNDYQPGDPVFNINRLIAFAIQRSFNGTTWHFITGDPETTCLAHVCNKKYTLNCIFVDCPETTNAVSYRLVCQKFGYDLNVSSAQASGFICTELMPWSHGRFRNIDSYYQSQYVKLQTPFDIFVPGRTESFVEVLWPGMQVQLTLTTESTCVHVEICTSVTGNAIQHITQDAGLRLYRSVNDGQWTLIGANPPLLDVSYWCSANPLSENLVFPKAVNGVYIDQDTRHYKVGDVVRYRVSVVHLRMNTGTIRFGGVLSTSIQNCTSILVLKEFGYHPQAKNDDQVETSSLKLLGAANGAYATLKSGHAVGALSFQLPGDRGIGGGIMHCDTNGSMSVSNNLSHDLSLNPTKRLTFATNHNPISFVAPTRTSDQPPIVWTLPNSDEPGVLKSDGEGNLSFGTPSPIVQANEELQFNTNHNSISFVAPTRTSDQPPIVWTLPNSDEPGVLKSDGNGSLTFASTGYQERNFSILPAFTETSLLPSSGTATPIFVTYPWECKLPHEDFVDVGNLLSLMTRGNGSPAWIQQSSNTPIELRLSVNSVSVGSHAIQFRSYIGHDCGFLKIAAFCASPTYHIDKIINFEDTAIARQEWNLSALINGNENLTPLDINFQFRTTSFIDTIIIVFICQYGEDWTVGQKWAFSPFFKFITY